MSNINDLATLQPNGSNHLPELTKQSVYSTPAQHCLQLDAQLQATKAVNDLEFSAREFLLDTDWSHEDGVWSHFAQWFDQPPLQNNPKAQLNLGFCLKFIGYPDYAECFRYAAELGYGLAQDVLARCYYLGDGVEKNLCLAYQWYKLASIHGCDDHAELVPRIRRKLTEAELTEAEMFVGTFKPRQASQ